MAWAFAEELASPRSTSNASRRFAMDFSLILNSRREGD
jgi:hypothetical protein